MELQNDVYSNQAADLLPVILPVLEAGNDGRFDTILPYLKNWGLPVHYHRNSRLPVRTFFPEFCGTGLQTLPG